MSWFSSPTLIEGPYAPPQARAKARFGLILGISAFASGACTNQVEAAEDAQVGASTHALLRIQHVESQDGSSRGDAVAGFLKIPMGADSSQVIRLAGLETQLPAPGNCHVVDTTPDWSAVARVTDAELLEADSVELTTDQGAHDLAPHAFPTVADLLRGVVYTSRDRSARALPPGTLYSWEGTAIGQDSETSGVHLVANETSPSMPSGVLVDGVPFSEIRELEPTRVIDLSWTPSSSERDLVILEVETTELTWVCSFNDAEGFGSVPLITEDEIPLAREGTSAFVTIHRVRSSAAEHQHDLDEVRITFDFALESQWSFSSAE